MKTDEEYKDWQNEEYKGWQNEVTEYDDEETIKSKQRFARAQLDLELAQSASNDYTTPKKKKKILFSKPEKQSKASEPFLNRIGYDAEAHNRMTSGAPTFLDKLFEKFNIPNSIKIACYTGIGIVFLILIILKLVL